MTRSGVCVECKKKSNDLVWSQSRQGYVDWKCMNKIIKEKLEMEGKDEK